MNDSYALGASPELNVRKLSLTSTSVSQTCSLVLLVSLVSLGRASPARVTWRLSCVLDPLRTSLVYAQAVLRMLALHRGSHTCWIRSIFSRFPFSCQLRFQDLGFSARHLSKSQKLGSQFWYQNGSNLIKWKTVTHFRPPQG